MRFRLIIISLLFALIFPVLVFSFDETKGQKQEVNQVNYTLPFPGILPDHPLYPLKVIRDKIYDFLLSDLVKKANFKLLMADKRFAMGVILMNKGKPELAERTISKASKYYEEGILILNKAQKEGRNIDGLDHKFIDASLKYQELIDNFSKNGSELFKSGLKGSLDRILRYRMQELNSNKEKSKQGN